MARPRLVVMGRAAGAFGLKGELRVTSFARDPGVFLRAGQCFIGPNPERTRPLTVVGVREHGGKVLLRTREITVREEAAELKGMWVFLRREDLDPLEEGEYYWFELKGLEVVSSGGRVFGRVKALMEAGAHDILVVEGEGGKELLIPVVEGVVEDIDVKGGQIRVNPPEGLLEAQGWEE